MDIDPPYRGGLNDMVIMSLCPRRDFLVEASPLLHLCFISCVCAPPYTPRRDEACTDRLHPFMDDMGCVFGYGLRRAGSLPPAQGRRAHLPSVCLPAKFF